MTPTENNPTENNPTENNPSEITPSEITLSELDSEPQSASEPTVTTMIPILLVDDHDIWRSGLRSMLERTEFFPVLEARTTEEALEVVAVVKPAIALLDIRLASGDGFKTLSALRQATPDILMIMLTTYDSPTFMARALAGGAVGYLLKGVSRKELLLALRSVAAGETLLSSENFVRSLHTVSDRANESPELFQSLSQREEEVLRLLSTGLSNREIASVLFIGEGTVKTHINHILNKLGANDRVKVAVWAARNGLAGPDTEER